MRYQIKSGGVIEALQNEPDNRYDAALFDPPYGLSFMGKAWDYDVPSVEVFREILRVLKPGAPVIFFGGTRTFHRMAVNAEDAGLELRDCLAWMYGSGFPKSLDVSKAIDKAAGAEREVVGSRVLTGSAAMSTAEKGGTYASNTSSHGRSKQVAVTAPATPLAQQWHGYGTALKPAWEPAMLARKPLDGTVAENVANWGVGGLAIDACRVEYLNEQDKAAAAAMRGSADQNAGRTAYGSFNDGAASIPSYLAKQEMGRWPANVCLDEEAAAALGEPSRFFYTAKVSKREREYGCDALPERTAGECTDRDDDTAGLSSPRAGAGRTGGARNHHPTLKPISLTTYLARLILPPCADAALLVPYSGAGSEMIGALRAGWGTVVGIEREPEYVSIAMARLDAWNRLDK